MLFYHRDCVAEGLRNVVRACPFQKHVHGEGISESVRVCSLNAGALSHRLGSLIKPRACHRPAGFGIEKLVIARIGPMFAAFRLEREL
jgi:hypothetical protein